MLGRVQEFTEEGGEEVGEEEEGEHDLQHPRLWGYHRQGGEPLEAVYCLFDVTCDVQSQNKGP